MDHQLEEVRLPHLHLAEALGLHDLAHLGVELGGLAVKINLVRQAAHEAPAHAGDLTRREGQVLVLGHAQRHRRKALEPRRAAQPPPAHAHAVQALGLVADADLAQLDPGAELRGQVLHQLAEVHPLLGREVERHAVPVELAFHIRQVHWKLSLGDLLTAEMKRLIFPLAVVHVAVGIIGAGLAQDLAVGRVVLPVGLHVHDLAAHGDLGDLLAPLDLDDHRVHSLQVDFAGVGVDLAAEAPERNFHQLAGRSGDHDCLGSIRKPGARARPGGRAPAPGG